MFTQSTDFMRPPEPNTNANDSTFIPSTATISDVMGYFRLRDVARYISRHSFKRVALQFPDHLLSESAKVVFMLQQVLQEEEKHKDIGYNDGDDGDCCVQEGSACAPRCSEERDGSQNNSNNNISSCCSSSFVIQQPTLAPPISNTSINAPTTKLPSVEIFILSDNTFGACCPDEVTAMHYSADTIVHFGYACMSKGSRTPIMYVHQREEFDTENGMTAPLDAITSGTNGSHSSNGADSDGNIKAIHQVVVVLSKAAQHSKEEFIKAIRKYGDEINPEFFFNGNNVMREIVLVASSTGENRRFFYDQCSGMISEEYGKIENETNGTSDYFIIGGDYIPRLSLQTTNDKAISNNTRIIKSQHFIFVGSPDSPILSQLALLGAYNDSLNVSNDDYSVEVDKGCQKESICVESGTIQLIIPLHLQEATIHRRTQYSARVMQAVQQRLRKRMFNIEVMKNATSIGILVCTLAIQRYRESADLLKKVIRRSGKKCYIIYIGHLNEHKIANFTDTIDCFVVIACPHSRVAQFPTRDDNMLKPLVSPVEALISLGYIDFNDPEAYTTDFAACCMKALKKLDKNDPRYGSDGMDYGEGGGGASSSLVRCGAVQDIANRTYHGLEACIGDTPVQASIVNGKVGVARGYTTEKESQKMEVAI